VRLVIVHLEPERGGDNFDPDDAVNPGGREHYDRDDRDDRGQAGAEAKATPPRQAGGAQGDRDRGADRAREHFTATAATDHDDARGATASPAPDHDPSHDDHPRRATTSTTATDNHASHHDVVGQLHPAGWRR
jgi:hypothetical protein